MQFLQTILTVLSACLKCEMYDSQCLYISLAGVLQGSKVLDGHRRGERDVHSDDQEPENGRRRTLHLHCQRVQRPVLQRLSRS